MKRLIALVASCFALEACACRKPPEPMPDKGTPDHQRTSRLEESADARGLDFAISSELARGRVVVRLMFRNSTTERTFWIRRAPLVYTEGSPITDVWLEIGDSNGQQVLPNCRIRPGIPEANDYLALAPMAEFSAVTALDCFGLESGRYTIVAHYKDSGRGLPPESPRAVWFRGELTSRPIDVEITADRGQDPSGIMQEEQP